MFSGAHFLLYSTNADADRAFLKDVLGLNHVDAGHGWLIFALTPSEIAVHPADEATRSTDKMFGAELYYMCDDLQAARKSLEAKNVKLGEIEEARWGIRTTFTLPSGGRVGLYQPKHKTALDL